MARTVCGWINASLSSGFSIPNHYFNSHVCERIGFKRWPCGNRRKWDNPQHWYHKSCRRKFSPEIRAIAKNVHLENKWNTHPISALCLLRRECLDKDDRVYSHNYWNATPSYWHSKRNRAEIWTWLDSSNFPIFIRKNFQNQAALNYSYNIILLLL